MVKLSLYLDTFFFQMCYIVLYLSESLFIHQKFGSQEQKWENIQT